jgi:glycosyltransferase involved in cell wall biosynthesis
MTISTPLVTVGLPVYNGEAYVGGAIESVLAQDLADLELVISDNGSTDATREICAGFAAADDRVRYCRTERNTGAASNYNRVAKMARGKYFKWATHDDLIEPSFLARCVKVLDDHPEVSLCHTRVVDIDERGKVLQLRPPIRLAAGLDPHRRVRRLLLEPTACFEILGVTRTEQLLSTRLIGPYTSSDRTLLLELALLGEFYEIDAPLAYHRDHAATSTNRYNARERNAWFDPRRATSMSFPSWRLMGEYGRAVGSAPVSRVERARSALQLPAWAAANWRRLGRDAARGAVQGARRLVPYPAST